MTVPDQRLVFSDPDTARTFVDAVASMSRYGEHPSRLGREMLLSNYTGIEPTLESLDEIERALAAVEARVAEIEGHRGAYLRGVVGSARAVLGVLQGDGRSYLQRVKDILQVDLQPIPERESERLRARLADGLGALGYAGSLGQQVEAWLEGTSLRGEEVIEFGRRILARARADTVRTVTPLPEGEGVDSLDGVRDVFYSGRSKYTGAYRGWLKFNIDKRWQRDVFVQVLCHEAYPGHQTFYSLWDEAFRNGEWPIEAAFYTRNSATNTIFEGGPEVAMHLIGWDVGDDPEALALRVGQVYKDLGRIAMNDACLYLNTGEMTPEQAIERMRAHFVLPDDAERVVRFVTNPVSRTHYPQYYWGRRIVNLALERMETHAASRREFLDILYRTPHTTETFVDAVAAATGEPFDPFAFP